MHEPMNSTRELLALGLPLSKVSQKQAVEFLLPLLFVRTEETPGNERILAKRRCDFEALKLSEGC